MFSTGERTAELLPLFGGSPAHRITLDFAEKHNNALITERIQEAPLLPGTQQVIAYRPHVVADFAQLTALDEFLGHPAMIQSTAP